MYKDIIKPTLVLIIISVTVGLLLSLTYNLADIGSLGMGIAQEDLDEYIKDVLPEGSKLVLMKSDETDEGILGYYEDESNKGIAIYVSTKGYGGDLKALVGLDNNGQFTGAKIVESAETPGLGSKIAEPDYLNRYIGQSGEVALKADGGSIDGIAGATISSRAFTDIVNKAFQGFERVK